MDDFRAHERNLEEEWISKYRAALQAEPERKTWDAQLYRIAYRAGVKTGSAAQKIKAKAAANKTIARWLQVVSPRAATVVTSARQFSVSQTLHAFTPKKGQAARFQEHSAKKAG